MTSAAESWDAMSDDEQAGIIQRTAQNMLDSPTLREWTPERLRRENPADSLMYRIAVAMDAELAAREARKRLRVVAGEGPRLPSTGARPEAPSLRVLEGYAPSSFAG